MRQGLNAAINRSAQGPQGRERQRGKRATDALKKYARDLTAPRRRKGKLDPVIGRDEEIRRTIQDGWRAAPETIPS